MFIAAYIFFIYMCGQIHITRQNDTVHHNLCLQNVRCQTWHKH